MWQEHPTFKYAKKAANALRVVNDSAERNIALAATFNSSITKNEEEKQYLFQVFESHRKCFPDCKKLTLLGLNNR